MNMVIHCSSDAQGNSSEMLGTGIKILCSQVVTLRGALIHVQNRVLSIISHLVQPYLDQVSF